MIRDAQRKKGAVFRDSTSLIFGLLPADKGYIMAFKQVFLTLLLAVGIAHAYRRNGDPYYPRWHSHGWYSSGPYTGGPGGP